MKNFFTNLRDQVLKDPKKARLLAIGGVLILVIVTTIVLVVLTVSKANNSPNNQAATSYPISYLLPGDDYASYPVSYTYDEPYYPYEPVSYGQNVTPYESDATKIDAYFPNNQDKTKMFFALGNINNNQELSVVHISTQADTPLYADCVINAYKGSTLFNSSGKYTMYNGYQWNGIYLPKGLYNIEVKCTTPGGKVYTDGGLIAEVIEDTSACDTYDFNIQNDPRTVDQAKEKIVGKWVGCASYPLGTGTIYRPYAVEFTFTADGKFSSRNIEIEKNPDTFRRHVALYYGSDKDSDAKVYELKTVNNDSIEGTINVWTVPNDPLDKIQNLKFNADNSALYFEVMHLDKYGPLKYSLKRVE